MNDLVTKNAINLIPCIPFFYPQQKLTMVGCRYEVRQRGISCPDLHNELVKVSDDKKIPLLQKMAPINIPSRKSNLNCCQDNHFGDLNEDDNDEESAPPHIIIANKKCSEKMAYSMCVGRGRTLKGRDLIEMRDFIHKLTGFIETS